MAQTAEGQSIFDGQFCRARVFQPGMKRLIVSFDSLRPNRSGFDDRGPVRFFLAKGWTNLVVQNAVNDWYLNDELDALRGCLTEFVRPYHRVISMGFSMGGFGALLMSRALNIQRMFLVSPQVTPFSQQAPRDLRYRKYEARMRADLGLTPADLNPGLSGFVLFDPLAHKKDRAHARMIAQMAPGLQCLALPMAGHPADKTILEAKLWSEFQGLLTKKDCSAGDLKALHRRGRMLSPTYKAALGQRMVLRANRNRNEPPTEISLP